MDHVPEAFDASLVVTAAILGPLAAAFFGHAARRQIRKSNNSQVGGYRLAAVGLTLGYLEVVLVVLQLFLGAEHPPRIAVYEATAVGSLHSLNHATNAYAAAHPQEGFPKTLKALAMEQKFREEWAVDADLAGGVRSHYRFTYVPGSSAQDGIFDRYQLFGDPSDSADQSMRHFFTDQTGVIRYARNGLANESSAELK